MSRWRSPGACDTPRSRVQPPAFENLWSLAVRGFTTFSRQSWFRSSAKAFLSAFKCLTCERSCDGCNDTVKKPKLVCQYPACKLCQHCSWCMRNLTGPACATLQDVFHVSRLQQNLLQASRVRSCRGRHNQRTQADNPYAAGNRTQLVSQRIRSTRRASTRLPRCVCSYSLAIVLAGSAHTHCLVRTVAK